MRPTCRDCARKHLAQAIILAIEERTGYPSFKWLVIGHLAEAEAELVTEHPDVANELREYRKEYEVDSSVYMPLMHVIDRITEIDEKIEADEAKPKKGKK
jgi:hypothetical protein